MSKKIVLRSSDKEEFEIDEAVGRKSQVIALMLDDNCRGCIPIKNVESKILALVLEYCTKHVAADGDSDDEDLDEWDANFMKEIIDDQSKLFDLINAANYLNIESLFDLSCKTVAEMIANCETLDEIRLTFHIVNDYSPEEEGEFIKEMNWAFDDDM